MPKLMKRVAYAKSDLTGELQIVSHKVEENQFGKEQDVIYAIGKIDLTLDPDKEPVAYVGDIAITRSSLINQIARKLGEDTDKWLDRIVVFKDGNLINIMEDVAKFGKGEQNVG